MSALIQALKDQNDLVHLGVIHLNEVVRSVAAEALEHIEVHQKHLMQSRNMNHDNNMPIHLPNQYVLNNGTVYLEGFYE
ncbi:TPA: hypothetical protein EYN98_03020 [Candidatus Poribacteria bacterium]|nr:hypothetical protein [Candidatus Poribacteria bacterium]HIB86369.1 hypothetical protein [Candidatus Poribacteria bacterium]